MTKHYDLLFWNRASAPRTAGRDFPALLQSERFDMASKPKLSLIASAIKAGAEHPEAVAIASALLDYVAAETAIERLNEALVRAKEANIPWGDARKPSEGGLVIWVREALAAASEARGKPLNPKSFDNKISLIGWCYKSGNRLQTFEVQAQQGKLADKPIVQLDLLTGEPKAGQKNVTDEAPQKAPTKRSTREKDCADWFLKAVDSAGYLQVMGFMAASIRGLTADEKGKLDAKAVTALIMEANVKAKRLVSKKDGSYRHA